MATQGNKKNEASIEALAQAAKLASGRLLTERLIRAHKQGELKVVSAETSGRTIGLRVKGTGRTV